MLRIKDLIFKSSIILTFLNSIFLSNLFAATQGSTGSESEGSIDVNIALSPIVKVSGLDDINFPLWSGRGDLSEYDQICIYSNTGNYQVTLTGSGSGGAFTVSDGSNIMPYNAYFNDRRIANGIVQVSSGVPLTGQTGADHESIDCSRSPNNENARVRIDFLESTLATSEVSYYSGTLIIAVSPE
jgi:hypothetical protein